MTLVILRIARSISHKKTRQSKTFNTKHITKGLLAVKTKGHATLGVFRRARLDFLETTLRQSTPRRLHWLSHWDFRRAISCSVTVSEDDFLNYIPIRLKYIAILGWD